MNFKDIKTGYPLYILDRKNMTATTRNVTSISLPHIDAKVGGVNNLVVDITTDDGKTYVMIAESEAAYPDGMVITTKLDNVLRELTSMRNTAQQALDRVDKERNTVTRCNELLAELDPAQREKQQTEARFSKIETNMESIMSMLKKLTD